jgi:DNA-binding transcriptional LysR family regulator
VPALLSFWLIPMLGSFTAQYPEIRLTLDASNDPGRIHAPNGRTSMSAFSMATATGRIAG